MPDIAELSVRVSADTAGLDAGLARANRSVSTFGSAIGNVMSGIGMGVGMKVFDTVTSGFEAAGKAAIGFNSNLEQSTIAFTSMLGSGEKAQAFLAEMKQFAATTPFEFPDLLQASKQMMAFGFAAKDVRPLLTAVGSAAAAMGTGRSGVDSITKALGQMKAATVVQAGELNQLTEQGVPAFQILADKMGITTGEVKKLASEGKIASDVFIDAFQVWANSNYGDMMAKQALTFEGAMSNIKDSLTFAVSEAFKPFFEVISAGAVELSKFVQSETFSEWAKTVADTTRDAFRQVGDAVRTVRQVLAGDWAPSDQIETFTLTIGKAALAVKQFIDTARPYVEQLGQIFEKVLAQDITGALDQFVTLVGSVATRLSPILAGWGRAFLDWIGPMIPPFLAAVANIGTQLLAWIAAQVPVIASALLAWGTEWVQWLIVARPLLLAAAGAFIQPLLDWIAAQVPVLIAQLLKWGQEFVAWVAPQIPPLLAALGTMAVALLGWLAEQIPPIIAQLLKWGAEFVAWVGPQIGPMLSELGKLILAGLDWIIAQVPGITAKLVEWGLLFGAWVITTGIPELLKALPGMYQTLVDWIASAALEIVPRVAALGKALVQGIYDGFVNAWGTIGPRIRESIGSVFTPPPGGIPGATQMSWRGAGPANPNASQADVEAFAYQTAKARGWSDKDARELVSLISGEGAGQGARALGDSGRSFGPMQLFTGGGLGNAAESAGINLRDPSTWQQQILFGMDTIEREGAGQWSVARNRGLLMSAPVRVPNTQLSPSALGGITMTQATWGTSLAGMTAEEAAAACGPYAAFLFAQATGRNPNPREAEELARLSGWTEAGMGGTGNFMNLLGRMGVRAVRDSTPTEQEAINAGSMVGFSTPKHYFVSQGYDPATGKFNVGATGTYGGGSSWMSYDEIARVGGGIQDIIALAGQMGPAFEAAGSDVLTSVTTLADGSQITISQMGSQIMATVTDSTGNVVASYGTMTTAITEQTAAMTTAVPEQMNLMTSGALTSVTALGDGTLTTVHAMAGDSIATVTDMNGQITSQYATLSNGAQLTMGDMANGVLTSVNDMGAGMVTIMEDANGNMVATVTDASGKVTSQYASTATAVAGSTRAMGASVSSFSRDTARGFGAAAEAAKAYSKAVKAAAEATVAAVAKMGGSKGDSRFAKGAKGNWEPDERATGGPVSAGTPYIVGEKRPELFVPDQNGYILPRVPAMRGGGGESVSISVHIDGNLIHERDLEDTIAQAVANGLRRGGTMGMRG